MRVVIGLLLALGALAACGGTAPPTSTTGPTVELKEWQVVVKPAALRAGRNVLTVRNMGSSLHELTIVKTDKAADKLANDGAKVTEPILAISATLNPGQTTTLTVDLAAGNYVFICNQPGHYPLGMRTAVQVQ